MSNSTIQRAPYQGAAAGRDPPRGEQRYRLIKTLGTGGMGDVYLAEDLKLPRYVAIKTIRKDLCQNAEIRKRIERECQLHAKIGNHPHIVTLYDQLEEGNQISLVMEYVEGQTLRDLQQQIVQQGATLPWRQSVEIIRQCLGALARIHTLGIVHRDVKPGNILLGRDDSGGYCAKLMDFGIARPEVQEGTLLTRTGSGSPGTPLYMAPEQIDPQTFGPITPATDIYAIGVVLYHLLAGKPPFEGSITQILTGHLTREPPPLMLTGVDSLSPTLRTILERALKKMPQERFPTAKAFGEALERALRGDPQAASVDTEGAPGVVTQIGSARTMLIQPEEAAFKKGATLLSTSHVQPRRGGMVWLGAGGVLLALGAAAGYVIIERLGEPTTAVVAEKPATGTVKPEMAGQAPPPEARLTATSTTPNPPAPPEQPQIESSPVKVPATQPPAPEPSALVILQQSRSPADVIKSAADLSERLSSYNTRVNNMKLQRKMAEEQGRTRDVIGYGVAIANGEKAINEELRNYLDAIESCVNYPEAVIQEQSARIHKDKEIPGGTRVRRSKLFLKHVEEYRKLRRSDPNQVLDEILAVAKS